MSNLSDLPAVLASGHGSLRQGRVDAVSETGWLEVRIRGVAVPVSCRVLHAGGSTGSLEVGDEVLVWTGDADGAVVLGRVGLQREALRPVVPPAEFAARPEALVIETQGDLVLRNGQARIRLGAAGDIEIVCASFVTRSQRLLRLLAPFIKLN